MLSIIEREMNGSPGLMYMESVAQADGTGTLSLTFENGTNEDLAQVDVQNRLSRATPRLPSAVTQQGVQMMMLPYGYPFEPNFSGTLEGKTFLYRYADTPKELQDKYIEASTNLTVAGGLGKMQFGSGPMPGGNGSGLIR